MKDRFDRAIQNEDGKGKFRQRFRWFRSVRVFSQFLQFLESCQDVRKASALFFRQADSWVIIMTFPQPVPASSA